MQGRLYLYVKKDEKHGVHLKIFTLAFILLLLSLYLFYKITVIHGPQAQAFIKGHDKLNTELQARLQQHVLTLAEEIGERHHSEKKSLDKAAQYIKQEFVKAGFEPTLQLFNESVYCNIIAEIAGNEKQNDIIIIGAHYDTVWLSPGADDNASGVAALLEIARALSGQHLARTVRLIAFTNEEQPFADTEEMGSKIYVRSLLDKDENIIAMFSLEMLGFYSDKKGSQRYPAVANLFYPDTASFIAFVSNLPSRSLLISAMANYSGKATVPAHGLAVPEFLVPDIRRSDHASFWDFGYPAVMITDTADYRNINYHTVGDVIGTLDFNRMAGVVAGLINTFELLANED